MTRPRSSDPSANGTRDRANTTVDDAGNEQSSCRHQAGIGRQKEPATAHDRLAKSFLFLARHPSSFTRTSIPVPVSLQTRTLLVAHSSSRSSSIAIAAVFLLSRIAHSFSLRFAPNFFSILFSMGEVVSDSASPPKPLRILFCGHEFRPAESHTQEYLAQHPHLSVRHSSPCPCFIPCCNCGLHSCVD